ncbi:MAG: heavy metal translocating P-type ATPase [Magnetococcales bacterium]|nr:heavy metal translocating P-type ATPase [Magnetococcales bacterium]
MVSPTCHHCGLPASAPGAITEADRLFCCAGCQGAWRLIQGLGLEDYYRHRTPDAMGMQPVTPDPAALAAFDDPLYQNRLVRVVADEREANLILDGLHCAACVWLNEQVLRRVPGVTDARIHFATHRAKVRWKPEEASLSGIIQAVRNIGYRAEPYDPSQGEELRARQDREMLSRLGVAGFGAANVMFIAIALYAGYFQGMDADAKSYFHWVSGLLATPVITYSGAHFTRGAWNGLRAGRLAMDLPIALGAWVTFLYSVVVTIRGVGEVYFDSVTMFLFVLLAGRYLEAGARAKAAGAMERLLNLEPRSAVVIEDGQPRCVPVREVRVGDCVLIKPGERIPVDGIIVSGKTSVDESMLTGEGLPVSRGPGETLAGGTQNLDGGVTIQATRVGEDTALARILRMVERAQSERPPIQGVADRMAARFVGSVLVLAAITLVYWLWRGDPGVAVENSVAVLIITCACALGLGAPSAMVVAMGSAARMGILLKNGETVERLARVTRVTMDKTGVVTLGAPRVERLVPLPGVTETTLLERAVVVERHSEHPLGKAITRAWQERCAGPTEEAEQVTNSPGMGLEAIASGRRIRVGRAEYVLEGSAIPPLPEDGPMPVTWSACAEEGRLLGWIGCADAIKPEAEEVVGKLHAMGLQVMLLSGDRQAVVEAVGLALGVDRMVGGVLPEGKEQMIGQLQQEGAVTAMVGDGVNDAPALARADVALVVANAADLAVAAADVALLNRDFRSVARTFALARRTMRTIRQNYLFSMSYNLIAIPLAMSGHVSPIAAAISMPLSSLVVVGNSLRLRHGSWEDPS